MPIFDQGYQHWKGPLSGHGWRWLAVARHGVRAQLTSRTTRLLMLACWMPAILLVVALALWGLLEQQAESVVEFLRRMLPAGVLAQPREYRTAVWTVAYSYFFKAQLAFSLFMVLVVGPNLISRDLRFNSLPLYFSRPLRRVDYFLGKLAVIGYFLASIVVVPAVVAYLLGVGFSLDLGVVRETYRLLGAGVLYGLVITVSAGTLMLTLSSLSRRSLYVGLAWAGFCFFTSVLSSILIDIRFETEREHVVQEEMARWVQEHPPPPGIEMVGVIPVMRDAPPPRPGRPFRPFRPGAPEQRWYDEWMLQHRACWERAEDRRQAESRRDWRPLCSYATNLERMEEVLLDTDAAWVSLGRAVERPRAMLGPVLGAAPNLGELGQGLSEPANDRRLADRRVWQYPWYWSAGVLGGLLLLSAWILSWRIKSLDRLR
jgi:ABC-type transport system involved in multi-copper enzyme maturation permease subunit